MGPIAELDLGMLDRFDAAQTQSYLKEVFGCTLIRLDDESYRVKFPSGAIEEVNKEKDPRYREDTLIKLPGEKTLRKIVKWPCSYPGCTHTYLFDPNEKVDAPRRRRGGNYL